MKSWNPTLGRDLNRFKWFKYCLLQLPDFLATSINESNWEEKPNRFSVTHYDHNCFTPAQLLWDIMANVHFITSHLATRLTPWQCACAAILTAQRNNVSVVPAFQTVWHFTVPRILITKAGHLVCILPPNSYKISLSSTSFPSTSISSLCAPVIISLTNFYKAHQT